MLALLEKWDYPNSITSKDLRDSKTIEEIRDFYIAKMWEKKHPNEEVPTVNDSIDGRTGFWCRYFYDWVYYDSNYKDYTFDLRKGWKPTKFIDKFGWDSDYDKITAIHALKILLNQGPVDIEKFFDYPCMAKEEGE